MSLFPANPTNGQTVTVNGIIYTYDSSQTAWVRFDTTGIPYYGPSNPGMMYGYICSNNVTYPLTYLSIGATTLTR